MHIKHWICSLLRRFALKTAVRTAQAAALATALAAGSSPASAGVLHVAIDTAGYGAAGGYLGMQLSGSDNAPLLTVLVNNMAGFDPDAFVDLTGVTAVAGGYLLRNDRYSELFHAANFGGQLSFDLTFAGDDDPLQQYASRLMISAFDGSFNWLGAFDPATGALAVFTWTPSVMAGQDGSIALGVSDPNVTVVPEPAGILLMGGGLALIMLMSRRRGS